MRVHSLGTFGSVSFRLMLRGPAPTFLATPPILDDEEIALLGYHVFQSLVLYEGVPRRDTLFIKTSLRVAYETTCRLKSIHFSSDNILTPTMSTSFGYSLALHLIRWANHGIDTGATTLNFPSHSYLDLWGPRIAARCTQHVDIHHVDDIYEIASNLINWRHSEEMDNIFRP